MSLWDYTFTDKTTKYVELISIPYKTASKERALEVSQALKETTIAYDKGSPLISDETWDDMYFWLKNWMEKHPGELEETCLDQIYFKEVSKLEKVEHNHPLLSLNKTKDLDEIQVFCKDKECLAMLKMDGLTCSLTYKNGKLVRAETRGNGYIGEDITHNAKLIKNIPRHIDYRDDLTIDGEMICTYKDFESFANKYKNPRNFAAGSIRLLNSEECYNRHLTFIAWDCSDNIFNSAETYYGRKLSNCLSNKLLLLMQLGFDIVPWILVEPDLNYIINWLQDEAKENSYPIDGIVFKYNDCDYYESLGMTDHHARGGLAYKFYDETYETTLRDIEWGMGRTGVLTPVAIFDEVDTGDAIITRANLHNISIMEELGLDKWYNGLKIEIYQANMIIPQVKKIVEGQVKGPTFPFEMIICPICGAPTKIRQLNDSKELICTNPECEGQLLNRLEHFCSKKGLDIKGLSKATLNKLMDYGWINCFEDIFTLPLHSYEWANKEGFGPTSVNNILTAIENAKNTTLDKFISAIGIPLIGQNVSKILAQKTKTYTNLRKMVDEKFNFSQLDGFAEAKTAAILNFDYTEADKIYPYLHIAPIEEEKAATQALSGKVFVITGRLNQFKNRDELKAIIEKHGGKVTNAISSATSYLINNDITSNSTKNRSAKERGIPIISEEQFMQLI